MMKVMFDTEDFRTGPDADMIAAIRKPPKYLGGFTVGRRPNAHDDPSSVLYMCWEDRFGREFWLAYDPFDDRVMACRPLRLPRVEVWLQIWIDRLSRWIEALIGSPGTGLDHRDRRCYGDNK